MSAFEKAAEEALGSLRALAKKLRERSDWRFGQDWDRVRNAIVRDPLEENLLQAMRYTFINKVEGDYLEFGCFQGRSMTAAYHSCRGINVPPMTNMRFFGFDSFKGLPPPDLKEGEDPSIFSQGMFACSRMQVEENLRSAQVDLSRITLTEGFFGESLSPSLRASLGLKQAAVVLVDCDLYTSTVPVLDFVTPLLTDGSLIIFDDWFCYRGDPNAGEMRACKEWLAKNPELYLIDWTQHGAVGKSFIVRRR